MMALNDTVKGGMGGSGTVTSNSEESEGAGDFFLNFLFLLDFMTKTFLKLST
jgi:hypothetical protein